MTPARTASHGLVIPPPLHRWMHAVLMLFAELVSRAASILQMVLVRRTRECHTKASPEDLPRETSGIHAPKSILRNDCFAILQDEAGWRFTESRSTPKHDSNTALMLRDCEAIVSKHEGVLTGLSPLMPTNVGIQGEWRTLSRLAASIPRTQHNRSWIPTFVGMSGDCCELQRRTSA